MASLKQELKKILIQRQHKRYERELMSKNLSYDGWIRQQEEKLNIPAIKIQKEKRQINECEEAGFETGKIKNDADEPKNGSFYEVYEIIDESGQCFRDKMKVILSSACLLMGYRETLLEEEPDIVLITMDEGRLSGIALPLICREFFRNPNSRLIYGDEDTLWDGGTAGAEGVRENPWFKPDWSPDRFLSCFYFGSLVAVRTEILRKAFAKKRGNRKENPTRQVYELLFELLKEEGAFKTGHDAARLPVSHIRQVLYHKKEKGYEWMENLRLPEEEAGKRRKEGSFPLVSVIIPSKDNPEALFHCLDSLFQRTVTRYPFEIILVDNGSNEENHKKISQKIHKLNGADTYPIGKENAASFKGIRYFYESMPFNFSRMCNLGAERAGGELYLFLNDDMEILLPDWMEKMAEKACFPYAGAVGAKLLYPDSDTIQHAGITNLRVGPAHKLQFLSDKQEHYFGMNRGVHNMLAVTGACLMVRKDVFERAGGFREELAVAFNDVDLCYTIFEMGYYNIERNDVTLYHHESLSRGNDGDAPEKQLRLLKEKDMLYERHQELYGNDPFYHPYLTTDMLEREYSPAYRYQVTLEMPWAEAVPGEGKLKKAREDRCLVVGMECAMDIYKWQHGVSPEKGKVKPKPEDMGYYFQGYSFVIGADNACYKKKLLLKNEKNGKVWMIPVDDRYRQDIKKNLKDQKNVDLTGFAAKLRKTAVPAGTYRFGMLAEDECSRQRLVNWSNWVLEITAEGK